MMAAPENSGSPLCSATFFLNYEVTLEEPCSRLALEESTLRPVHNTGRRGIEIRNSSRRSCSVELHRGGILLMTRNQNYMVRYAVLALTLFALTTPVLAAASAVAGAWECVSITPDGDELHTML